MAMEFRDIFTPGVRMSRDTIRTETKAKRYPADLKPKNARNPIVLTEHDRVDPTRLEANAAYVYRDALYVTDKHGQLAYVDADLRLVENTAGVRDAAAQRRVGGKGALHEGMDAGHPVAISLGGHPSFVVEQSAALNRYSQGKDPAREDWQQGVFRDLELEWWGQVERGDEVNIKAVFTQSPEARPGTYSPFWVYQVENRTTKETTPYVFVNEAGPARDSSPDAGESAQKADAQSAREARRAVVAKNRQETKELAAQIRARNGVQRERSQSREGTTQDRPSGQVRMSR